MYFHFNKGVITELNESIKCDDSMEDSAMDTMP